MREHDVQFVFAEDDDFPALLATIHDPPPALWIRGSLLPEDDLSIAIVGSRRCTPYGREQAERFGGLLAQAGLTIVSGGAVGIDGHAHQAALRVGGRTIAVLGSGLARLYPPQNKRLFERMVEQGNAIISEFPMHAEPRAEHFPRRNRIISGMGLGVLVVEAAKRSGALITARLAADDHGREVMAIPGRVDSPASAGCLKAIREGWASVVIDHADVIQQLDGASHLIRGALEAAGAVHSQKETLFQANLTEAQQCIVEALETHKSAVPLDQLAANTGLPVSQLQAELTLLEIRSIVRKDHSGVALRR